MLELVAGTTSLIRRDLIQIDGGNLQSVQSSFQAKSPDTDSATSWVVAFGPFRVTKARRLLERHGEPAPIGGRAFDILTYLLERPGQVVSKRELLAAAWPNANVEEGSLRFQVTTLRKALGNNEARCIVNVSGRGYCFTGRISKMDGDHASP